MDSRLFSCDERKIIDIYLHKRQKREKIFFANREKIRL